MGEFRKQTDFLTLNSLFLRKTSVIDFYIYIFFISIYFRPSSRMGSRVQEAMEGRGVYPGGPLGGREVVAHSNIPQPTLGIRRVQSREPPRDLHIPNPTMPNQMPSPSASGQSQATTPVIPTLTSPFPASVARSLRNINPSRDNFRKIQDSIGQTLGDFKSTCQTLSYPSNQ